jgi:hypothetical protein
MKDLNDRGSIKGFNEKGYKLYYELLFGIIEVYG